MNKELAKTLTTALVQFIDNNRPEGSMCCSNMVCKALEKALVDNDFESVEYFIQHKRLKLTEFEDSLRQVLVEALSGEIPTGSSGSMSWAVAISDDEIKKLAPKALALAKKELVRRDEVITLDNLSPYDKGFQDGKAEALKDLPRWNSNLKSSMVDEANVIGPWLYYKEHRIRISDLEKLPGFKEEG